MSLPWLTPEDDFPSPRTHADPDPEVPRTNFTLMMYLNEGFEEGETVFFEGEEELTVVPKAGTLLIIPGDIEHEARMPKGKNKYISIARHIVV